MLRMHALRGVAAATTNRSYTANGLGFKVLQTEGAGRGIFATRDLHEGETILTDQPVVAHPAPASRGTVCYHCLRPRAPAAEDGVEAQGTGGARTEWFCSSACHNQAAESYLPGLANADLSVLETHCRAHRLKFPMVVARLASVVAAGRARSDALEPLCFAKVESPPPDDWVHEHALLVAGLRRGAFTADQVEFLTLDWYVSQIARLHLNAFRVELVRPVDFDDMDAILAASVAETEDEGGAVCGTAVYLVPSMLNHSCDPNVDVQFPRNNSTMHLQARRGVAAGEQLSITYIDAAASVATRRKELQWGYGFSCQCARCVEENE